VDQLSLWLVAALPILILSEPTLHGSTVEELSVARPEFVG